MSDELSKVAIFQKKEIRKLLHGGEWWFVLNDVVAVLTDSADPVQYLKRLRQRDKELSSLFDSVKKGAVQIVPHLPWSLKPLEGNRNYCPGILKACFDLFSQSQAKKQSHLNDGWLESVTSEYRK